MTHVAVIGGGVGGITCCEWIRYLGLTHTLFTVESHLGGILNRVYNSINDFPPTEYKNGAALAGEFRKRAQNLDRIDTRVERVERTKEHWLVDGSPFDRIVIATGTVYRTLGIPGEKKGLGDYVSQSASRDADRFAGRPVAVVGGGDAALENALILANSGCAVTLFARSRYRARDEFVKAVTEHQSIDCAPIGVVPTELVATDIGCRVQRSDGQSNEVASLFVRIGVDPSCPVIEPKPEKTKHGFLCVDRQQRTDLDGLYAIGDITDTVLRSVVTTMGDAARAAKSIWEESHV